VNGKIERTNKSRADGVPFQGTGNLWRLVRGRCPGSGWFKPFGLPVYKVAWDY